MSGGACGAQPCCSLQTGIVGMQSACASQRCIGMCALDAQTANSTAKAALQFTPEGIEAGGLCAARRARCTANLVADIVKRRLAGEAVAQLGMSVATQQMHLVQNV